MSQEAWSPSTGSRNHKRATQYERKCVSWDMITLQGIQRPQDYRVWGKMSLLRREYPPWGPETIRRLERMREICYRCVITLQRIQIPYKATTYMLVVTLASVLRVLYCMVFMQLTLQCLITRQPTHMTIGKKWGHLRGPQVMEIAMQTSW